MMSPAEVNRLLDAMQEQELLDAIVRDLGLEYIDEPPTREDVEREVFNRGYDETTADAVVEFLGL